MSLRSVAERALHGLGAVHLVRAAKRSQCRILMYHRFSGPEETVRARVEAQCEHLRRYYTPVTLSEIAEAVRKGTRLPENGLAITVDDAYRDLRIAFPVFQSYALKVTVYVVSEFSAGALWLWTDHVKLAFQHAPGQAAAIPLPSGEILNFSLTDPKSRGRAADQFEAAAMRLPNQQRLELMRDLPGRLNVQLPVSTPAGFEALSWDELRTLAAEGLEIGSHTRTHPIVSRLESEQAITDEIAGSQTRIEEALGLKVRHFCYPNGRREDYDERCIKAVRATGYETAVSTEAGLVSACDDPFRLKRIGMDPSLPSLYFERRVAGLSS